MAAQGCGPLNVPGIWFSGGLRRGSQLTRWRGWHQPGVYPIAVFVHGCTQVAAHGGKARDQVEAARRLDHCRARRFRALRPRRAHPFHTPRHPRRQCSPRRAAPPPAAAAPAARRSSRSSPPPAPVTSASPPLSEPNWTGGAFFRAGSVGAATTLRRPAANIVIDRVGHLMGGMAWNIGSPVGSVSESSRAMPARAGSSSCSSFGFHPRITIGASVDWQTFAVAAAADDLSDQQRRAHRHRVQQCAPGCHPRGRRLLLPRGRAGAALRWRQYRLRLVNAADRRGGHRHLRQSIVRRFRIGGRRGHRPERPCSKVPARWPPLRPNRPCLSSRSTTSRRLCSKSASWAAEGARAAHAAPAFSLAVGQANGARLRETLLIFREIVALLGARSRADPPEPAFQTIRPVPDDGPRQRSPDRACRAGA